MMSSLTCRELTEKVDDYLDGDIGWWEWLNFRMHILGCGHCMTYLRQTEMTIKTLGALPGEPVPDEVRDGLMDAFRAWQADKDD